MKRRLLISLTLILLVFPAIGLACSLSIPSLDLPAQPAVTEQAVQVEVVPEAEAATDAPVNVDPPPVPDLIAQQDAFVRIYQAVSPGVVSIQVLNEFGGGSASGFVYDKQGHIITNLHVIEDAEDIIISFPSGIITEAQAVGTDADSDLAVLKVDISPDDLIPLPLGDSDSLQIGQVVVAIGNPFGLNGSMSTGIISSIGRTLESMNAAPTGGIFTAGDLIQTDAAINPGNSGGPLLNLNGEVVGVNRAIRTFNFTETADPLNSGIGFAVSVNLVKRVAPALIEDGFYPYPYLGITTPEEISLNDVQRLDLERATGVLLSSVTTDGPAEAAGLQADDVIISIQGREVRTFGELITYLFMNTVPGDTVTLEYIRNGDLRETDLVVGARP